MLKEKFSPNFENQPTQKVKKELDSEVEKK